MRCPDCDGDSEDLTQDRGNGICSLCHGGGVGGMLDEVADGTNPFGRGQIHCDNCAGSGRCPTCDGSGYA